MRRLKPISIITLGVLLSGAAIAAATVIGERDVRTLRGVWIGFSVGAAFGLVMFGPMALAERFHAVVGAWLERHWSRIRPYLSYVMGLSLGYFLASARHQTFDAFAWVAMGLVGICAIVGMALSVVTDRPRGVA